MRSLNCPTPTTTGVFGSRFIDPLCTGEPRGPNRGGRYGDLRLSGASSAVSAGVLPTLTPAASRASFLAAAVPDEPDTIAPAWPIVLPSGAVNPATSPTTGLDTLALM